jgi:hypothetical protein
MVTFVDYQLWVAALEDFHAESAAAPLSSGGCGLGPEVALALWLLRTRRARRRRGCVRAAGVLLLALCAPVDPASALTIANVELAQPSYALGTTFDVEIVASFDAPVLGFGLDIVFDPAVLAIVSAPLIVAPWTPVFAPDGDGLAALAPPEGVVGSRILLVTVTFEATGEGTSSIELAITTGDLTEGFPLKTGGFDAAELHGAEVTVVPEPGGRWLVALALLAAAWSIGLERRSSVRGFEFWTTDAMSAWRSRSVRVRSPSCPRPE